VNLPRLNGQELEPMLKAKGIMEERRVFAGEFKERAV
jgi:hypothetical protein